MKFNILFLYFRSIHAKFRLPAKTFYDILVKYSLMLSVYQVLSRINFSNKSHVQFILSETKIGSDLFIPFQL